MSLHDPGVVPLSELFPQSLVLGLGPAEALIELMFLLLLASLQGEVGSWVKAPKPPISGADKLGPREGWLAGFKILISTPDPF